MTYSTDSEKTTELLRRIADGSTTAVDDLIQMHRSYLHRLISYRMSPAMARRVDPSDIVQETHMAVARRIDDFLERRPCSFRIWIRRKALERLAEQFRRHVGAEKRSVRHEQNVADSSLAIARKLMTDSPSKIVRRQELREQIQNAIDELPESDREILLLRHVEGLSHAEAADLLEISLDSSRQRFGRALRRLHQQLGALGIDLNSI